MEVNTASMEVNKTQLRLKLVKAPLAVNFTSMEDPDESLHENCVRFHQPPWESTNPKRTSMEASINYSMHISTSIAFEPDSTRI